MRGEVCQRLHHPKQPLLQVQDPHWQYASHLADHMLPSEEDSGAVCKRPIPSYDLKT